MMIAVGLACYSSSRGQFDAYHAVGHCRRRRGFTRDAGDGAGALGGAVLIPAPAPRGSGANAVVDAVYVADLDYSCAVSS